MFDKILNKLPYSSYVQEYIGWIEFSIIEYLETVAQPRAATLLKRRDSDAVVFLWIFRNF